MRIKLTKHQNEELLSADFNLELAALALESKAVQAAVKPSTAKRFSEYAQKLRQLDALLVQIQDQTVEESEKRRAAKTLGALGGSSRSEAKTKASRENGKLGGRPRKS
jgi:hypothetical protein